MPLLKNEIEFTPSQSNPYLSIAKHYNVDYGDLLMYADVMQGKYHGNDKHYLPAYNRIVHGRHEYGEIERHVNNVIARLG